MKKALIAGVTSAVLAALPVAMSFAATTDEVTASVKVNTSCTIARLAYGSGGVGEGSSHKNGTGSVSGTWGTSNSTLTATVSNGFATPVDTPLGKSNFNVTCNDPDGYTLKVATSNLTAGGDLVIPANANYSASVSGWGVIYNGSVYANTEGVTLVSVQSSTNGTAYEVGYGVGISGSQAAGTYTGTATYTVAGI